MTPEPISRFRNDESMQLWRQRYEPAAVTVRCGRGKRGCDRLALIYETPESAVVVFYQHTPDVPAQFDPAHVGGIHDDSGEWLKRVDADTGASLLRGLRDQRGTVVCLERDDYWADVVNVGCTHHLSTIHLTRGRLMEMLREARSHSSGRVSVAVRE